MKTNKLEHIWSVVCSNSSIDQETNNISLYNVLEQVNIAAADLEKMASKDKIVLSFMYEIISLWQKTARDQDVNRIGKIECVDPDGNKLDEREFEIAMKKGINRLRTIAKVNGFRFTKPGVYNLNVSIKQSDDSWAKVASLPLEVRVS